MGVRASLRPAGRGGHNAIGPARMDALSMLEDWLDGREPPDAPPAHDIDPVSRRTFRSVPACRYPAFARHDGNGDPNDAAGFTCAARPDPIGFRPD